MKAMQTPGTPSSDTSSQRDPLPTIVFAIAAIFLILCGVIAVLAVGKSGLLDSGPKTRVVLEPDYSLVSAVDPAALKQDAEILTQRAALLGTRVTFTAAANDQVVAEVSSDRFSQELFDKLLAVGLLEIVDLGETPLPNGSRIATDFAYEYFPPVEGTRWHTVITNADFGSIYVEESNAGDYQVWFILNPAGTHALADYTSNNIGHYLGIVMDKVVLSAPVVKNPITNGQGAIEGGFTQQTAEALAAYLQVKGPLPIPLKITSVSSN